MFVLDNKSRQIKNSLEKRVVYHNYDKYGNPVYISKDNTTNIVYLWSYRGQYPVAEIQNATYQDVKAALNWDDNAVNTLSGKTLPAEADWNSLSALRSSLPNSFITIYKYNPLVGVSQITDSRGVTTYYNYDAFGRLTESYYYEGGDTSKKRIIESYEYHYKNQ